MLVVDSVLIIHFATEVKNQLVRIGCAPIEELSGFMVRLQLTLTK